MFNLTFAIFKFQNSFHVDQSQAYITLNNISSLKKTFSTITMQPQENPARYLLGLHDSSTEGFFLKNLICGSHVEDHPADTRRGINRRRWTNVKSTFIQRRVSVGQFYQLHAYPADTIRWINIVLMLVKRCRRWTNIEPTWFNVLWLLGTIMLSSMLPSENSGCI